jgi:hypothetical protein
MAPAHCHHRVKEEIPEHRGGTQSERRPSLIVDRGSRPNDSFDGRWLQKICRASAWLLALAIVVLSLVPPSYRPITEASHNIEHLAIFLRFAFCVAYPDSLLLWRLA